MVKYIVEKELGHSNFVETMKNVAEVFGTNHYAIERRIRHIKDRAGIKATNKNVIADLIAEWKESKQAGGGEVEA